MTHVFTGQRTLLNPGLGWLEYITVVIDFIRLLDDTPALLSTFRHG